MQDVTSGCMKARSSFDGHHHHDFAVSPEKGANRVFTMLGLGALSMMTSVQSRFVWCRQLYFQSALTMRDPQSCGVDSS